ncbi:MAG: CBS domain-containing protein [Deltaproteobacteria bacterium]|nr:CBS domain-containing protein [Deltaproteobacteria bacterium]MBW2417979.1 CBS domain-containing protein [Deltaproteobacteria bacterium]
MLVRDYMTTNVVCANLRDGLRQTYDRMLERGIRHLPVVDDDEKLIGIVSDRDIRRPKTVDEPNVAHSFTLDNSTAVEEAMSGGLMTVKPEDSIERALDLLLDGRHGALPVVDPDSGNLVGILTTIDLLKALRKRL